MTLYLDVISFQKSSAFITSSLVLVVNGSQSGQLISKPLGDHNQWAPPFKIICSSTDQLIIRGYPSGKLDQGSMVGQAKFHSKSFIKKNQSQLSMDKYYTHEIVLEKEDTDKGIIKISIKYDKAKKYEGEFTAANTMNFGNPKKVHIEFYKGKCPTTNLFSFLDSGAQGQNNVWIEGAYRDK